MKIKDLFVRDLARNINGVVKADQLDESSVWQELDEYVVTKELDIHFRDFFGAFLSAIDNSNSTDVAGKVGIWISGFFGSGKSHFIKVLSYLLSNHEATHQGESKKAVEFFNGKIQDSMHCNPTEALDSMWDLEDCLYGFLWEGERNGWSYICITLFSLYSSFNQAQT